MRRQSPPHLPKILVTGAVGFIGRAVVQKLETAGCQVIACFRPAAGKGGGGPRAGIETDLLDPESVQDLGKLQAAVIVHCAAVLPGGEIGEEQAAEMNRSMDESIIRLCRESGSFLVFSSSSIVYGSGEPPWSENSPLHPEGRYAAAKCRSEEQVLRELGDRAALLRVSAPYGPGQRTMTVLRLYVENAATGADLLFHGSGRREQDFTAVEDVAAAVLAVIVREGHGVFNIASGRSISMKDLARLVVRLAPGTSSRVRASGLPDPQEAYRAALDISRAGRILDWSPQITLESGIGAWLKDREEGQ